jgi:hypothetical protein
MLTLRKHHERLPAGLPVRASCVRGGVQKSLVGSRWYPSVPTISGAISCDRTPAIGFAMNPEVAR